MRDTQAYIACMESEENQGLEPDSLEWVLTVHGKMHVWTVSPEIWMEQEILPES
jgi:hypothetical protein